MNERLELVPLGYKRRVEISHRLFSTILQPYIISSLRAPITYIDINTNANKLINQQSLFAFHNSSNGIFSYTPQKTMPPYQSVSRTPLPQGFGNYALLQTKHLAVIHMNTKPHAHAPSRQPSPIKEKQPKTPNLARSIKAQPNP